MVRSSFRCGLMTREWLWVGGSLAVMAALIVVLWNPIKPKVQKGDLVLFCAAGLLKPVQEISADYEKEYGVKVRIEPDASGALLAKLRVAPDRADLFLAGEESYVREAHAHKLVAEVLPVARQHLVIAVKPGNPRKIAAVADLLREEVTVALPNPELTAVGKSAQRALAGSGEWEALQRQIKEQSRPKVSLAGKVTEAAQAVKIGTADAALVWDATARQFDLEIVEIPAFQKQPPEMVTLGVLAGSENPTGALHFGRYLTASDRGQLVFKKNYLEPLDDADQWEDRPALTLMAGAMLKPAIDGLIKSFARREGVEINTIYNGCGILVAQMKAIKGAQETSSKHFPDAYFSCDVSFMNKVQQWFEAVKLISRNDMVLAVPNGNPKGIKSIEDLARPELRVGLCHPQNSALGALTDDLLKKLGLHEKVYTPDRTFVHPAAGHELVNQMRVGSLDVIVVYRSNVLSAAEVAKTPLEIVEMNLPEAKAIQPYAVAKDSQHKYLMRRLLDAILSPQSHEHFTQEGFQWIAEGGS